MKELPIGLKRRMDEAGKDGEWAEKVRGAESWETYVKLLEEKGIELPAEVKDVFDADSINKTGKLEDNDLEKVTGGWKNVFNCPGEYNLALCEWTFCPHKKTRPDTPDEDHYDKYCDLGYWSINCMYPQRY